MHYILCLALNLLLSYNYCFSIYHGYISLKKNGCFWQEFTNVIEWKPISMTT